MMLEFTIASGAYLCLVCYVGGVRSVEEWQVWLFHNLMSGADPSQLLSVLCGSAGLSAEDAETAVAAAASHPAVRAGRRIEARRKKLGTLLTVLDELSEQAHLAYDCPIEKSLPARVFFSDYYYRNRPVVVRGLMADWPALSLWTPEFFAERFGDEVVEVAADRESDPRFEDNFEHHRQQVRLRDLVRIMLSGRSTNDVYLVAKNSFLADVRFRELHKHFDTIPGYLVDRPGATVPRLWMGPAGTITPLHHDGSNIFFGQVYGRKLVRLLPPSDIARVYNDSNCFSAVDLEDVDLDRFPMMADARIVSVVLQPGDFLLLPVGWWHWVKSLEPSISLSFQNFAGNGVPPIWRHTAVY